MQEEFGPFVADGVGGVGGTRSEGDGFEETGVACVGVTDVGIGGSKECVFRVVLVMTRVVSARLVDTEVITTGARKPSAYFMIYRTVGEKRVGLSISNYCIEIKVF